MICSSVAAAVTNFEWIEVKVNRFFLPAIIIIIIVKTILTQTAINHFTQPGKPKYFKC